MMNDKAFTVNASVASSKLPLLINPDSTKPTIQSDIAPATQQEEDPAPKLSITSAAEPKSETAA